MLCAAIDACTAQRQPSLEPIVRARAALAGAQVASAESAFKAVIVSDSLRADRVEAYVALANLAWRVRRDVVLARRYLAAAESVDSTSPAPPLERSRMEHASRSDDAAAIDASVALARSALPSARLAAGLALGAARVEALVNAPVAPAARRERLAPEIARLRAMVRAAPGDPRPARLLLLAAALADDSASLFAGWDAYYLVGTGDFERGPLRGARGALAHAVAQSMAARHDLAAPAVLVALGRARLFEIAHALGATAHDAPAASPDSAALETLAYAALLRAMHDATDEFYRRTALGRGDERSWRAALDSIERAWWPRLQGSAAPAFSGDRFADEIGERFGAVMRFTTTGGFVDFDMSHIVVDDARDIEQYGRSTTFHFTVLDEIVSNGFLSWFWDGRGATGGWNSPGRVVQVRPLYASAPAAAWWSVADSAARASSNASLAADSARDAERARGASVPFYLPSVAHRLSRAGALALLDSLRGAGLGGELLEAAFMREYAAMAQRTVIAHEARHAIDRRAGTWLHWVRERLSPGGDATSFTAELEYNAKLSEIAFAPDPRLAFGAIMAPNVGDGTPHGAANSRLLAALARWITRHAAEVPGFDRQLPALAQLPLLSPAQLRAAARSLDPLAPISDRGPQ